MSTPNDTTIVVNLKSPVNPTWLEEDILGSQPVMPAQAFGNLTQFAATPEFWYPTK
jgi:hypothetical protein